MSPRVDPHPADAHYRVVVTEISHDQQLVVMDTTGEAFVAAVATLTGSRITATADHDGPVLLRHRLLTYITNAVRNT